ncbi:unnamed protein product, partial [Meganyctiphanes norvegica]
GQSAVTRSSGTLYSHSARDKVVVGVRLQDHAKGSSSIRRSHPVSLTTSTTCDSPLLTKRSTSSVEHTLSEAIYKGKYCEGAAEGETKIPMNVKQEICDKEGSSEVPSTSDKTDLLSEQSENKKLISSTQESTKLTRTLSLRKQLLQTKALKGEDVKNLDVKDMNLVVISYKKNGKKEHRLTMKKIWNLRNSFRSSRNQSISSKAELEVVEVDVNEEGDFVRKKVSKKPKISEGASTSSGAEPQ